MNTGSYVNGKWFHPQSSRLVRNLNPADPDDVIAEFPAATAEDVRSASIARKPRREAGAKRPAPSAAGSFGAPPTLPANAPTRSRER
jgi:NAD-dependent aldehyde dehydrogenases